MPTTPHWSDEAIAELKRSVLALRRRVRVVIVEDSPDDVLLLRELLKPYQCDITEFCSARECLVFMRDNPALIDLVFLDIKLLGMSGLDLVKTTKLMGLSFNYVITTGYDDPEVQAQAHELGVIAIFKKPPTREQMDSIFGQITKS